MTAFSGLGRAQLVVQTGIVDVLCNPHIHRQWFKEPREQNDDLGTWQPAPGAHPKNVPAFQP